MSAPKVEELNDLTVTMLLDALCEQLNLATRAFHDTHGYGTELDTFAVCKWRTCSTSRALLESIGRLER